MAGSPSVNRVDWAKLRCSLYCYAPQEHRDRRILMIDSPCPGFLLLPAGVMRNLASLKQTAR